VWKTSEERADSHHTENCTNTYQSIISVNSRVDADDKLLVSTNVFLWLDLFMTIVSSMKQEANW